MKKLLLNVEDLTVETFDTTPLRRAGQGTVRGFDSGGVKIQTGADDSQCNTACGQSDWVQCDVTNVSCVGQTDESCYGDTCYGVSCGPEGSCSEGCSPSGSGGCY